MPDRPDYPRSAVMSRVRGANTAPERVLRAALHARGVRFRLDQPITLGEGRPIKADVVFKGRRIAVFVDGCFWHGCPTHCRMPSSNQDYWDAKIARNVARDRATDARLRESGWHVIRVWEHADLDAAAGDIAATVRAASPTRSRAASEGPEGARESRDATEPIQQRSSVGAGGACR